MAKKNKNNNQFDSKKNNSFDDLTRYQAKNEQSKNNAQNSQNNQNKNSKSEQNYR